MAVDRVHAQSLADQEVPEAEAFDAAGGRSGRLRGASDGRGLGGRDGGNGGRFGGRGALGKCCRRDHGDGGAHRRRGPDVRRAESAGGYRLTVFTQAAEDGAFVAGLSKERDLASCWVVFQVCAGLTYSRNPSPRLDCRSGAWKQWKGVHQV